MHGVFVGPGPRALALGLGRLCPACSPSAPFYHENVVGTLHVNKQIVTRGRSDSNSSLLKIMLKMDVKMRLSLACAFDGRPEAYGTVCDHLLEAPPSRTSVGGCPSPSSRQRQVKEQHTAHSQRGPRGAAPR